MQKSFLSEDSKVLLVVFIMISFFAIIYHSTKLRQEEEQSHKAGFYSACTQILEATYEGRKLSEPIKMPVDEFLAKEREKLNRIISGDKNDPILVISTFCAERSIKGEIFDIETF